MLKGSKRIVFLLFMLVVCGLCLSLAACNKCDHTYGEWTVGLKPTCMLPGRQDRVCTICGEKESQTIEPLGHSAVVVDEVPSTCQSTGLSSYEKCERCNNILLRKTFPLPSTSWSGKRARRQPAPARARAIGVIARSAKRLSTIRQR